MRGGEWFKPWRRRDSRNHEEEKRKSTGRHGGGSFRRTAGWWKDDMNDERTPARSGKPAIDPAGPMAHGLF